VVESRIRGGSWTLVAVVLAVLGLIAASVVLWTNLPEVTGDGSSRERSLLLLFGIAGALGSVLRSLGYWLARGSFNRRESEQWRTEALIGPVLGAVVGLASYLAVAALLVGPDGSVNKAGMYLISAAFGSAALSFFGRFVERGLLRASLSRTGIMGSEVSPTVPLLNRLEQMLEQRVADLTIVNYEGYALIQSHVGNDGPVLEISFDSRPAEGQHEENLSTAKISIAGGIDREFVTFTLSVLSQMYAAAPLLLTVTVPRHGRSEPANILLEELDVDVDGVTGDPSDGRRRTRRSRARSAILEISQGTQTVQIVPIHVGP
jgi:hypothetical protein